MKHKVHCLSRQASYALLIHVFNRQGIFLVFLNSEAVSNSGAFIYGVGYIISAPNSEAVSNSGVSIYGVGYMISRAKCLLGIKYKNYVKSTKNSCIFCANTYNK